MGKYSSFLYADPSFTEGMARIMDFGNTLTEFNRSTSPDQADAIAITADWNAVIEDLAYVFRQAESGLEFVGVDPRVRRPMAKGKGVRV